MYTDLPLINKIVTVDISVRYVSCMKKLTIFIFLLVAGCGSTYAHVIDTGLTIEQLVRYSGSKTQLDKLLRKYAFQVDSTLSKAGDSILIYHDVNFSGLSSYVIRQHKLRPKSILVEFFYNDSAKKLLLSDTKISINGNQDIEKYLSSLIQSLTRLPAKSIDSIISEHFQFHEFVYRKQHINIFYTPRLYLFISID